MGCGVWSVGGGVEGTPVEDGPRLDPPRWVRPVVSKVDVRLPGKGNGARPVHLIITMIKWIRTSRLSIKNSFSLTLSVGRSSTRRSWRTCV